MNCFFGAKPPALTYCFDCHFISGVKWWILVPFRVANQRMKMVDFLTKNKQNTTILNSFGTKTNYPNNVIVAFIICAQNKNSFDSPVILVIGRNFFTLPSYFTF